MALHGPTRGALLVGLVLVLAGCATPYQRMATLGGYYDLQIGEEVFLVSFRWTRFIPPERIMDCLLLGAAEVALEQGAPSFLTLAQEKELRTDLVQGTQATQRAAPTASHRPTPPDPAGQTLMGESQRMDLRFRLIREPRAGGPPVLDAAKTRAELRAKYSLGP